MLAVLRESQQFRQEREQPATIARKRGTSCENEAALGWGEAALLYIQDLDWSGTVKKRSKSRGQPHKREIFTSKKGAGRHTKGGAQGTQQPLLL